MSKGEYSLKLAENKSAFKLGFKDGVPIGLAYFAVSFSLGIAAKNAGLTAVQGFIVSTLCTASAGEYVGFAMIAASASLAETAITTLITNARYILMSCALSQRIDPKMPFYHRFIMAHYVTDELFGIAVARKGFVNPWYSYGAILFAAPCWSVGTFLGVIAGNLLPLRLVSAFSITLYGMFLAIIIPPCKKDKAVFMAVAASFALSALASYLPVFADISSGTKTIFLTLAISSAAAYFFPVKEDANEI